MLEVAQDIVDGAIPQPKPLPSGRDLLARFLLGSGIELGPGHNPLPLPFPGASVRYVDRWEPEQNRELFPDLADAHPDFPKPHIVANLDDEGLSALGDSTQDFVIASHILEHLADPLHQLGEMYRVLRPGGPLLVLLPDRRYTFDSKRLPTPLDHLIGEHQEGVTRVSDEHIEEFLRNTTDWSNGGSAAERRDTIELHRRRSIHVHCWTQDEFLPVIEHCITSMDMQWEMLDAFFTEEAVGGFEFGLVLRRSTIAIDSAVRVDHLRTAWSSLEARARANPPGAQHDAAQEAESNLRRALDAEARLERLRRMPGYGVAARLYRMQRRLRSRASRR